MGIYNPSAAGVATSVVIGTTVITGGVANQLLYDNGGVLGEITKANSSVLVTNSSGVPSWSTTIPAVTLTTPAIGVATGTSLALGGATIGTNALAATGTITASGNISAGASSAFRLGTLNIVTTSGGFTSFYDGGGTTQALTLGANNFYANAGQTLFRSADTNTTFATIDGTNGITQNIDRGLQFANQTNGSGAQTATLTNAPASGNPGFWLKIKIGGVSYTIPCWAG